MTVAVVHATTAAGPNDPSKQVSSDAWNAGHTITGLATVAGTGAYSDLTGIPATFLPSDGNKGDITVSGTGTAWAVNSAAITYAKIQNVSATSKFLGRKTAGAGVVEELSNADAKTILAIASTDVSGLGSLATISNLTGPITSVGAATAIAAQTGTGTTFAMQASPTFTGSVVMPDGTKANPSWCFTSETGGGLYRRGSQIYGLTNGTREAMTFVPQAGGSEGLQITNRVAIGAAGSDLATQVPDVVLIRDAANVLALRNSVTAQTCRVYTSFTDGSNYERFGINTVAGTVTLAAESAGTGSANVGITLTPKGTGVVSAPLVQTSYSPGSFTLADETGAILVNHLKLSSTQRATLSGSSNLTIQ